MSQPVALVHDAVPPYRIPIFEGIARVVPNFVVLFTQWEDPRHAWEVPGDLAFDYRVSPKKSQLATRWGKVPLDLQLTLRRLGPKVLVIGGWGSPTSLVALHWAWRTRTPYVLWSESFRPHSTRPHRRQVRSRAVERAAAVVVPGERHRSYLMGYGVDSRRVFKAPNISAFTGRPKRVAAPGSHSPLRMLYVGRFSPEKGVLPLAHALLRSAGGRRREGVRFTWIGDGPQREELRRTLERPPTLLTIEFRGFLQPRELSRAYSDADVFVFPSLDDVWGIVLNEAAEHGLPLVASTAAGATDELCLEGLTGLRIDPHRGVQHLADKLDEALDLPPQILAAMGAASRRNVESHFNLERCIAGFDAALAMAQR